MTSETQEPGTWQEALQSYVTEHRLRWTQQRQAIAEVLFEMGKHANVDEIFMRVRKTNPSIGYATVHRTLKLLEESGLAESRRFSDGPTRYEAVFGHDHHDHLICRVCGKIFEFENPEIERLQLDVATANGFVLTAHKMELYGHCRDYAETGAKCE